MIEGVDLSTPYFVCAVGKEQSQAAIETPVR